MKKIMFSDRFGLTQAVKDEIKNNTRRVAKDICHSLVSHVSELHNIEVGRDGFTITYSNGVRQHVFPAFQIGDEVAVAQSYKDCGWGPDVLQQTFIKKPTVFPDLDPVTPLCGWVDLPLKYHEGWENKMFVLAGLMPCRIRITNIRFERLQDISNEDCLREGIVRCIIDMKMFARPTTCYTFDGDPNPMPAYKTPKEAFATLIDKISGKGTWDKNPWVFVYEFEKIK